jgi:hypothetical protein
MLAEGKIHIKNAVIDGGITPYQLPRFFTVFIAVRDFLMVCMGKWGGRKLLMKAFSADEYSDEDLKYVEKVLRFMSYQTIWRTFDSCNNYKMPESVPQPEGNVEYWYADAEEKARAWDIGYIKKEFSKRTLCKIGKHRSRRHGIYPAAEDGGYAVKPDKTSWTRQQIRTEEG